MCRWITSCETLLSSTAFSHISSRPPTSPQPFNLTLYPSLSFSIPLPFPPLTSCSCPLFQGPQPEDGVPGRFYHAVGGDWVPLHPLPWPPRRTFDSKSKSQVSTHRAITDSPPTNRHLHFCTRVVFYFCFSCLSFENRCSLLFFYLTFFLHEIKLQLRFCVWCVGDFSSSFFPFHHSVPARYSPPSSCLFPQNNSLPLFTSHCACMFTVLLVMGIVMRQNCSVVFH